MLLGSMTTESAGWSEMTLDLATIQGWIDNPSNNLGILLKATAAQGQRIEFYSENEHEIKLKTRFEGINKQNKK